MSFYISLSGLKAAQSDLSTIANNVSNVNSTAFKKSKAVFGDIFAAAPMQTTTQVAGQGVRTLGISQQFTQGTIETTDKTLDLAITGEGFFKVQMPDGTFQYTRDGTFQMDNQGRIVTAQGNPVQPTITIPNNASGLTVNVQGQVSVTLPGSSTSTIIGQLSLTRFINKAGLQPVGNNQFTETPSSGAPQDGTASSEGYGTVTQGSLEQANVDVVSEMSDLIAAQRAYEMNAKVISAADQMMQSTTALFR